MAQANIVVPGQFYTGFQERAEKDEIFGEEKIKLGFATYQEDNSAFRKRQQTVDAWSRTIAPVTYENTPASGFKLSRRVTHGGGWNDLNVFWRIVDPRGFELEISSGNLAKLFQYCAIDHGHIKEECVWGWDKANQSKPVLLPVNSEIYTSAMESSNRHYAKSLNLKDLKIGDWVHLKNDTKGTFFGEITFGWATHYGRNVGKIEFDKSYLILQENGCFYFAKTPKVVDAKDGEKVYTKDEAEKFLNNKLWTHEWDTHDMYPPCLTAGNKNEACDTVLLTYDDPKTCKANLFIEEMSREKFFEYFHKKYKGKVGYNLRQVFGDLTYGHAPVIIGDGDRKFMICGNHVDHHTKDMNHIEAMAFIAGESDRMTVQCIEMFGPHDATVGLKLNVNPAFNENAPRYSRQYNDEYFYATKQLATCDFFGMAKVEFKGRTVEFYRR